MRLVRINILKIILGTFSFYPLAIFAEPVVIENEIGETYVIQVDSEDSFLDVVQTIRAFRSDGESEWGKLSDEEELHTFKITTLTHPRSLNGVSKKVRANARNYAAGTKAAESADIAYIVKTLANGSLPKIKSAESSLKKAGDRIDHIHPLQFLICVFTNEELKVCMRNLQGRTWVWKDFLSGITEALSQEDARGNLLPFIQDFATKIKVDVNILLPILQAGRWERFVNVLIELVPREAGADRYNI
jgi:hypothetical protein